MPRSYPWSLVHRQIEMHRNPLFQIVDRIPISSLPLPTDLLRFLPTQTVGEFLEGVQARNVISAPVVYEDGVTLLGFVDMLDVACYLCHIAEQKNEEVSATSIASVSLKKMVNFSAVNNSTSTLEINQVSFLLDIFATGSHRALVLRDDGTATTCSQSDVNNILYRHLKDPAVDAMVSKSVMDLGMKPHTVKSVRAADTVIEALKALQESRFSAIAVTGSKGELVANFSASALRGSLEAMVPDFKLPVLEFLQKHSPASVNLRTLSAHTSLRQCIASMHTDGLHRVWLVNHQQHPVGIVALTDVMKMVSSYVAAPTASLMHNPPCRLTILFYGAKNVTASQAPRIKATFSQMDYEDFTSEQAKSSGDAWKWGEACTLDVPASAGSGKIRVAVTVNGSEVGHVIVQMRWILNGFGTNTILNSFTDWFNLEPQGQVEMSFLIA